MRLGQFAGGFAVVNDNDFESAFKRIDAETSDYYVLGYYSTNPDPQQRVRAVDIKVTCPNVNVASRKAYSLKPTAPLPPPLPQPKAPTRKK